MRIPNQESRVTLIAKMNDVMTMAKTRRMQLRVAWWTTEIRVSTNVEAKL